MGKVCNAFVWLAPTYRYEIDESSDYVYKDEGKYSGAVRYLLAPGGNVLFAAEEPDN